MNLPNRESDAGPLDKSDPREAFHETWQDDGQEDE